MRANAWDETAADRDSLDDFDSVYEAYYQDVYRAVRAIVLDLALAEDITQNTFLKAYRHRARYRSTGRLGGWLHRIAVREAISSLRWRDLHDRLLLAIQLKVRQPVPDPTLGGLLASTLHRLNPGTRAAVILHYYHGYRYREVAEILGIPEGTVATRIANGLRRMKQVLSSE